LNESTSSRRTLSRLATGLLSAGLAVGVLGATGATATATTTYSTDTAMILNNVPAADLLANTRGICNGAFNIVVANVGGVAGALRYLDAAQHCGLKAVIHFSTTTTTGGTVYPSRVAALVKGVKNHPALLGYLTVKEPSWTHISGTEIRSLYHAFKVADPNHKVVALFGDIPHFGDTINPYTAGMADIVMVDWYPVETARGGCSSTGSTYITYGPKWYSTKVRPTVAKKTPGTPIWVMVQTHKYTAPSCHKKQRPTGSQLARQVHEALTYAGASGIAFHTFSNVNYNSDMKRDGVMSSWVKGISAQIRAGTF
jgi:hypothetical protein